MRAFVAAVAVVLVVGTVRCVLPAMLVCFFACVACFACLLVQDREEALKWTRAALGKPPGALGASQLAGLRHLAKLRVDDARAQAVEAQVRSVARGVLGARAKDERPPSNLGPSQVPRERSSRTHPRSGTEARQTEAFHPHPSCVFSWLVLFSLLLLLLLVVVLLLCAFACSAKPSKTRCRSSCRRSTSAKRLRAPSRRRRPGPWHRRRCRLRRPGPAARLVRLARGRPPYRRPAAAGRCGRETFRQATWRRLQATC
jgi:hypothetical protein